MFDATHKGLSYSPRYDYYLLFFPLCLAALILFHHFNLQAPSESLRETAESTLRRFRDSSETACRRW